MQTHICGNCGFHYIHNYCSKCGQQTSHRITTKHILHEFIHAFTHADKGLLHLFLKLFFHPGQVAYQYIKEGKRKKYFNPYQYLLIIGSLGAFIAVNSHLSGRIISTGKNNTYVPDATFMQHLRDIMLHYFNLIVLLNLPFFSIATYIIYRKYKYNFAEHLTLSAFIVAQNTFFSSLFIIFIAISANTSILLIALVLTVSFVYYTISYMQFFKEYSIKGFFRGVIAFISGYIFYQLFIVILTSLGYIFYNTFFKK